MFTKVRRRQTESVADEKSYLVGWPIRTDRSPDRYLSECSYSRSKLHFQPVLKDGDAYLECSSNARLGQWRVRLRGEGEGASVPSVLPRQEPF